MKGFKKGLGKKAEASDEAYKTAGVENSDRLTCQREDDLDLVLPSSPAYVIRKGLFNMGPAAMKRDIYVKASEVHIKKVNAILTLERSGDQKVKFVISGNQKKMVNNVEVNVAVVDFYLGGVEVLIQSGLIDWAASLVADRHALQKGQEGQLFFNLQGEAQAVWSEERNEYVVELLKNSYDNKAFQFNITSQYMLQEAMTKAGGIDKIIVESLWPVIRESIPKSLFQAFTILKPEELLTSVTAEVSGGMEVANGPLELGIEVTSQVEFKTSSVLEVLQTDLFDFRSLAENQVDTLILNDNMQELWAKSRDAFIMQIGHLGFLFNEKLKKTIMECENLADLRPDLVRFALEKVDVFLKGMKPFVDAQRQGKRGFFEGLLVETEGKVWWNKDERNGLILASLSAPDGKAMEAESGWKNVLVLPAAFLDAEHFHFLSSKDVQTEFGIEGFEFERGSIKVARMQLQDLQIRVEGNTTGGGGGGGDCAHCHEEPTGGERQAPADIYKINGQVEDAILTLPFSLNPGIKLVCPKLRAVSDIAGSIAISVGPQGTQIETVPDEAASIRLSGKQRSADEEKLNGTLRPEVARPTEPVTVLDRLTVVPKLLVSTEARIWGSGHGKDHRLNMYVKAKGNVTVKVDDALRHFLAPRPQVDFGYVFYSGLFKRWVEKGESALPKSSDVIVVVSCGYLRLLKTDMTIVEPLQRINMDPGGGQLELDLSLYTSAPESQSADPFAYELEEMGDGPYSCLLLYSSGYPARRTGGWKSMSFSHNVVERVCGISSATKDLQAAIGLQVQRFNDTRAKGWNFGTHPAEKPDYVLPNTRTVDLTRLVTEAASNSSNQTFFDAEAPEEEEDEEAPEEEEEEGAPVEAYEEEEAPVEAYVLSQLASIATAETHVSKLDEASEGQLASIATADTSASKLDKASEASTATADTSASKLDEASEVLPLEQAHWSFSPDRRSCRAREIMDRYIFPPHRYKQTAMRSSFGGMSAIGDLFVSLTKIQITDIDMTIQLSRKDDNTFTFEVTGSEPPRESRNSRFSRNYGHQHETKHPSHAQALLWIDGLELITPDTPLKSFAKGLFNVENLLTRSVRNARSLLTRETLNTDGDGGRLDRGRVDARFHLKGDFQRDGQDGWTIVENTAVQDAHIEFGRGFFNGLLNLVLEAHGGIKPLFFRKVWPLVVKMIPVAWGRAFEVVPAESGKVAHTMFIKGWCEKPSERRCDAEELRLDIQDVTHVEMIPKPIIEQYLHGYGPVNMSIPPKPKEEEDEKESTALNGMLQNIMTAYEAGKDVFKGVNLTGEATMALKSGKDVIVKAEAMSKLPLGAVEGIIGTKLLKTVVDFIPRTGAIESRGSMTMRNGAISIPETQTFKNIRLPIILSGSTEALELSATVKGFKLERVQAASNASSIVFDKDSSLNLDIPGFVAKLNRGFGLTSDFFPKLTAKLAAGFVKRTLDSATESLRQPLNTRVGPKDNADGLVPPEFQRPASRMPATFNLTQVIQELNTTVKVSLEGGAQAQFTGHVKRGDVETLKVTITALVNAKLDVGKSSSFWQGLLDTKDSDYGYIHVNVAGFFGPLTNGGRALPSKAGLLMLACGTLDVYEVESGEEGGRPFEDHPSVTADIRTVRPPWTFSDPTKRGSGIVVLRSVIGYFYCLHMSSKEFANFLPPPFLPWIDLNPRYFCAEQAQIEKVRFAVRLQQQRFADVEVANRQWHPGNEDNKATPDGTWFKGFNPKDYTTYFPDVYPPKDDAAVKSPWSLWQAAVQRKRRWDAGEGRLSGARWAQ